MIRIFMVGCDGAMGRTITDFVTTQDDIEISGGFSPIAGYTCDYPVYHNFDDVDADSFDVIVDFSHFSLFSSLSEFAKRCKKPLLVATTGLEAGSVEKLKELSNHFSVFHTANMSYGVNLLVNLVEKAVQNIEGFDIEIVESHHNKKADAPSGTALMIANAIKNNIRRPVEFLYGRHGKSTKRKEEEITIHAVRGGTIPGEHTVIFAGQDEILQIQHTALSKRVFAAGAIKAVRFIVDKPNGMYDMNSIINE
ncbi:MAG: 4-hydroxy-tetrahydrodipicolinate reductase [Eubacteriaceae bacterium]|jgi:4-hydroxy-tetrahydrodipicolinate reductase|nr:4-hydroxy-tetrahydrodipicolinate reductase [Eubacteriaceae bacterium]